MAVSLTIYSASENSMTLKTWLGVLQGYWKWCRSIDHIWLSSFYWSTIVNIALSCTTFELFDLEIWVIGHSRPLKLVPFESLGAVSYSPSTVTMALSCINSEIKWDINRKSWFLYPLAFDAPVMLAGFPSEYCHNIWYGKTRIVWLPNDEKISKISLFVLAESTNVTDRWMDRHTDTEYHYTCLSHHFLWGHFVTGRWSK